MEENLHKEHRDRVRKEFLSHGFNEKTPEHKILEMLLFYSIPRKDTNELAHKLIKRFGSFSGVLEADITELTKIDGIGESSAVLLKLMLPVIKKYLSEKKKKPKTVEDMNEVYDFLMQRYMGFTKEMFSVVSFDSRGNMCGFDFLSSGDVASVGITSRMVIETALKRNALAVVLAHNHPDGDAMPSAEDINVTRMIAEALKHVNIRLLDHAILCSDDYVSLRVSKSYQEIFN